MRQARWKKIVGVLAIGLWAGITAHQAQAAKVPEFARP